MTADPRQARPSYWYPRLTRIRWLEIPVPGREAVVGFLIVLAISLLLHLAVLIICWAFRTS